MDIWPWNSAKSVSKLSNGKIETWEKLFDDDDTKLQLLQAGKGSYQAVCSLDDDVFSLFRETSEEKARKDLEFLLPKLRPFLKLDHEHLNEDVLGKLCLCIWENPSWSVAHVAADCAIDIAFSSEGFKELINEQESEHGMTPLHVAVSQGHVDTVKTLTDLGAIVSMTDHEGHTSLHQAVISFGDSNSSELIALLASCLVDEKEMNNDIEEALTPLIMALKTKKIDAARIIVENNVLLDVPDETGRPIHHALKHDNYLLATEILAKNNRQGFSRCNKYNATPLHWARSSEVVKMIFKFDYELNTRSSTGHTAVHVMVKKGRNDCLVELLAAGADPEIPDNDGSSPLHTAALTNNMDAIRALIVFNADVNAKDHKGLTPRHYASSHGHAGGQALQALHMVGAQRCAAQTLSCLQGCLPWGQYDGDKMEYPHDPNDECEIVFEEYMNEVVENMLVVCRDFHCNILDRDPNDRFEKLLCLDGGGSRGIVEVQLLAAIERASDKRIIDCFDWIAGTSAGAVNTGILATGACLTEMRKIFFSCTRELFAGSKPYSGEKTEGLMKGIYGERKMMDIEKPRIMITGALSNRAPPALHFFRNFKPPAMSSSRIVSFNGRYDNPPCPPDEETLWRAVRASTAAPTYFPPKDLFMDGGLVSNNPTTDAMTEISEYYAEKKIAGEPVRKLGLVLSLGTGNGPVPQMKNIEVYVPQAVTDIFRVGANIKAAAHLGEIMLSLVTDARFRPAHRARAWCNDIGAVFFRLSPNLSIMTDLDETDNSVILKLMWETQVFLHNNKRKIDQIGALLSVM